LTDVLGQKNSPLISIAEFLVFQIFFWPFLDFSRGCSQKNKKIWNRPPQPRHRHCGRRALHPRDEWGLRAYDSLAMTRVQRKSWNVQKLFQKNRKQRELHTPAPKRRMKLWTPYFSPRSVSASNSSFSATLPATSAGDVDASRPRLLFGALQPRIDLADPVHAGKRRCQPIRYTTPRDTIRPVSNSSERLWPARA
jgi:hypothetical protein